MELSLGLILSIYFLYFFDNCVAQINSNIQRNPQFVDIVKSNGYNGKSYHVETEDGYILRLDRILGSPSSPKASGKPVVALQHPMTLSSELFVIWDPKQSIAYLLADAGYDVWIFNLRGNTNGRTHKTLSPKDHKFWDFSLDEHGTKDLPAQIDFILKKTEQPCLTFIGHSMGTTLIHILLSEKPEYNDKISFIVDLGPVVFFHYDAAGVIKPAFGIAIDTAALFLNAPNYAAEVLGHNNIMEGLMINFCTDSSNFCPTLAKSVFAGLQSQDFRHMSPYGPSGTSLKILQHYRQMMNSGLFRKYDYGSEMNVKMYGRKQPPQYDAQKTTTKVALIWTHKDIVANKMNVQLLAKQLPNVVAMEPISSNKFLHADFVFNRNATALVWNRIMELVNNYHECSIKKSFN